MQGLKSQNSISSQKFLHISRTTSIHIADQCGSSPIKNVWWNYHQILQLTNVEVVPLLKANVIGTTFDLQATDAEVVPVKISKTTSMLAQLTVYIF